jgi:hypothetical protein
MGGGGGGEAGDAESLFLSLTIHGKVLSQWWDTGSRVHLHRSILYFLYICPMPMLYGTLLTNETVIGV